MGLSFFQKKYNLLIVLIFALTGKLLVKIWVLKTFDILEIHVFDPDVKTFDVFPKNVNIAFQVDVDS